MKKSILFLSLLTLLASCTTTQEESPFVTVRNGKFYQGGKEYRYVGTNFWYGAILGSKGLGGNRERLVQELDDMKAVGIDNVRVLIGGDGREGIPSHIYPKLQSEPGVYNDTILEGLDYMMFELEKRQMKAVLYFNNAWEWSGGYGAYLDWVGYTGDVMSSKEPGKMVHFDRTPVPSYDGWWEYMQYVSAFVLNDSAKALAANHVRFIVSRTNTVTGKPYSESPAIMAWELANEPRAFARDSVTKACFAEWVEAQAKLIKSLDGNHLVTTGSEGLEGCEYDPDLFRQVHAFPEIDYICIHIWPYNWHWLGPASGPLTNGLAKNGETSVVDSVPYASRMTRAYMERCWNIVKDLNKPMVLEEFGYPRDGYRIELGSSTQGRDIYYEYAFSLMDEGKLQGCCFWAWGGYAQPKHVRWQRWDDYVGDPAQEEQGLNAVFACDTTTLEVIRQAAEKLGK